MQTYMKMYKHVQKQTNRMHSHIVFNVLLDKLSVIFERIFLANLLTGTKRQRSQPITCLIVTKLNTTITKNTKI